MNKTTGRVLLAALIAVCVLTQLAPHAHAQSSLGIGANEATIPSTGLFAHLMNWINVQQQTFYRSLTNSLKAMRQDGSQVWILVGLSFAYGIFHAAGPGHGKAVISSYLLANEVALRRGIMLSFISAFLQAGTAIVMMALLFLVLRGTSISMTNATWFLEIASYVMISMFGAWLLWQKAWPRVRGLIGANPAHSLSAAHAHAHSHSHDHHDHSCSHPSHSHALVHANDDHPAHGHDHDHHHHDHGACDHHDHDHHHHDHSHHDHSHHAHDHGAGMVCSSCGHSHLPDPAMISGDNFNWKTAWSAVTAVGLRPCSGALIVLTFAFLNGLWAGGVLSVVAMAVGTAITVSALAILAVTAKNWAVAFAGDGRMGNRVHAAFEIGGAGLVLVLGLLLLTASLSA
ncbi:nickel/cobalt exporter [Mesorhizobium soli]|nr:nickel/cobalt exporter [Mesorhizobium soli]